MTAAIEDVSDSPRRDVTDQVAIVIAAITDVCGIDDVLSVAVIPSPMCGARVDADERIF